MEDLFRRFTRKLEREKLKEEKLEEKYVGNEQDFTFHGDPKRALAEGLYIDLVEKSND